MTTLVRWLGLGESRWSRVGSHSMWSAAAVVVVASSLMALNRFGGLAASAPRAFSRLALVGVWGAIGLAVAVWLIAGRIAHRRVSLRTTFGVVGLAHVPVLALSVVIFVFAVMAQVLGPGFVTAVLVFGLWFPASLVVGVHHVLELSPGRAAAIVAAPYGAWLLVVGRYVLGQVAHLL